MIIDPKTKTVNRAWISAAFLLFLLVTSIAVLLCMPQSAYAATTAKADAKAGAEAEVETAKTFINPIYEDVINAPADENLAGNSRSGLFRKGSGNAVQSNANQVQTKIFDDTTLAAEYLSEQMVQRQDTIRIGLRQIPQSSEEVERICRELFDVATTHTGEANKGDYLMYQLGSWGYQTCIESDAKGNYFSITYTVDFFTTPEQEAWVDQKINEITQELGLNDAVGFDAVNAIYKYITSHVEFDYGNLNDDDYTLKYTAYGALHDGKAVCQGYATLFYRLCWSQNVGCRIVTGTVGENNEPHAWNIVSPGNNNAYYNVDCTWDAGKSAGKFDYFLKCDANFTDHIRDSEFADDDFNKIYPMAEEDYLVPTEFNDKIYSSGKYSYQLSNDGKALITAYSGSEKSITVPAELDGHPVHAIGKRVFGEDCSAVTITLSEGIKGWYCAGDSSFYHCPNLKKVILPSTLGTGDGSEYDVILNGDRFYCCYKLESVTVAESNPSLTSLDGVLFTKARKVLLYYPSGASAESYTVPEGTVDLDSNAFAYQRHLKSVTLPETIDSIGYFCFDDAINLSDINIPESCTFIGEWAFHNTLLKSVHIPKGVEIIVAPAFVSACLETITVAEDNPYYYMRDGVLYSHKAYGEEEATILECYPAKRPGESFAVPDDVDAIGFCAFWYADNLKTVFIPSSVGEIDNETFMTQTDLTIAGEAGSAAARYAEKNGLEFTESDHLHVIETTVTPAVYSPDGSVADGLVVEHCSVCNQDISTKVISAPKSFQLSRDSYVYDGKVKEPVVSIKDSAGKKLASSAYTVTYENNRDAGNAVAHVVFQGNYSGSRDLTFTVNKAPNTLSCKGRPVTLKYSRVHKRGQSISRKKAMVVTTPIGNVTYKKVSGNRKFTVNSSTGKLTVKKGLKRGTFTVKIRITASGDDNFKAKSKTIALKIRVK